MEARSRSRWLPIIGAVVALVLAWLGWSNRGYLLPLQMPIDHVIYNEHPIRDYQVQLKDDSFLRTYTFEPIGSTGKVVAQNANALALKFKGTQEPAWHHAAWVIARDYMYTTARTPEVTARPTYYNPTNGSCTSAGKLSFTHQDGGPDELDLHDQATCDALLSYISETHVGQGNDSQRVRLAQTRDHTVELRFCLWKTTPEADCFDHTPPKPVWEP